MANKINIADDSDRKKLNDFLRKSFQSASINILIGSGCSFPAIEPLGNIEKNIHSLLEEGKELEAEKLMFDFLKPIAESNNKLRGINNDKHTTTTLNNYRTFIDNIFQIFEKSKNNILPKRANIFSTNYDLFIEKASENFGAAFNLNDGFNRNPRLDSQFRFSTTEFFHTAFNIGNLYNYKVEIPSINLIKLHGSLSWAKPEKEIVFKIQNYLKKLEDNNQAIQEAQEKKDTKKTLDLLKEFNNQFSIILPIKDKLRDTLIDRIYYDLLRIYSNELDKENTLLIAEGFSFEDEHILDITHRALKNPTLQLILFCHKKSNTEGYNQKFEQFKNVYIIYKEEGELDFADFNKSMKEILSQEKKEATSCEEVNNDK